MQVFLSCQVIKEFEDILAQWSFLLFFLPIVTSAGGNSGTQAASLIIRGLAIKELSAKDALKVLTREIFVGLSLGVILALIGFTRAITWGLGFKVGAIICLSVVSVVLLGAMVGSMLPFVFEKNET